MKLRPFFLPGQRRFSAHVPRGTGAARSPRLSCMDPRRPLSGAPNDAFPVAPFMKVGAATMLPCSICEAFRFMKVGCLGVSAALHGWPMDNRT